MTDASFVDRMGTDRVDDRGAARRRAYAAFQRAMLPNPKINGGRWGAAEKTAVGCLVGYVAVVWSIIGVHALLRWLR